MTTIEATTVTFKNIDEMLKVCKELASKNISMFAESTVIQDLNGWTIRVNRTCGESELIRDNRCDYDRLNYRAAKAVFEKVRNEYSKLQGRLSTAVFLGEKEPIVIFLRAIEEALPRVKHGNPKNFEFPLMTFFT